MRRIRQTANQEIGNNRYEHFRHAFGIFGSIFLSVQLNLPKIICFSQQSFSYFVQATISSYIVAIFLSFFSIGLSRFLIYWVSLQNYIRMLGTRTAVRALPRIRLYVPPNVLSSSFVSVQKPPAPPTTSPSSPRPPVPVVEKVTLAQRFVNGLPRSWQPYARLSRLDRPIGTWLLFAPCTWSLGQASVMSMSPISTSAYFYGVFLVGALLTRSAGCTINDIWDRDLDKSVERTKTRPLAAKEVTVKQASAWLGAQGLLSIGILWSLPRACWGVGAASIIPVLVYPLFKRFTYYPQIWLSIWFSWGTVMGFPALGLSLSDPTTLATSACLLTAATSWSMIYDTIYGHQDKADDVKVGVKSTALKWGERTKPIAYRFWALQTAALIGSGVLSGMGPGFYTGVVLGMGNLLRMIKAVDLNLPQSCGKFFKNNLLNGFLIGLGCLVDYLVFASWFSQF